MQSKLKISSDPDNYLKRVEATYRNQSERQRQVIEERKRNEVEECTFKPAINPVPEFVKRMADVRGGRPEGHLADTRAESKETRTSLVLKLEAAG